MSKNLQTLLTLARVSNLPTVWTNCLAAWTLGGGGFDWHLLPLLVGASLIYSGGMVLNDVADRKWDSHHRPERPIPSGAISLVTALVFAIGFLAFGLATALLAAASIYWCVLLLAAIVAYDLVHKRWDGAVYVMGVCRFLLYLVAASAAVAASDDVVGLPGSAVIWGAALGVYTVGITLAARGESRDVPVGWLPLALLAAPLVAAGMTSIGQDLSSLVVTLVCLLLWAGWVGYCIWTLKRGGEGRVAKGVGLLLAGMALIDATAVSLASWPLALLLVLMLPAILFAQRKFPAS